MRHWAEPDSRFRDYSRFRDPHSASAFPGDSRFRAVAAPQGKIILTRPGCPDSTSILSAVTISSPLAIIPRPPIPSRFWAIRFCRRDGRLPHHSIFVKMPTRDSIPLQFQRLRIAPRFHFVCHPAQRFQHGRMVFYALMPSPCHLLSCRPARFVLWLSRRKDTCIPIASPAIAQVLVKISLNPGRGYVYLYRRLQNGPS